MVTSLNLEACMHAKLAAKFVFASKLFRLKVDPNTVVGNHVRSA